MRFDDQGNLINRDICAQDVFDRKVDELLGICRGETADGSINQKEAEFLLSWIESNRDRAPQYPFNILYDRLIHILEDGILDEDEQADLLDTLQKLTGGELISNHTESMSSLLPIDDPAPEIIITGKSFIFTGTFTTGPRTTLQKIILDLGGDFHKTLKKTTNYLVIGDLGSNDWKHSSFGRKIEKAIYFRDERGADIKIVHESHWAKFI